VGLQLVYADCLLAASDLHHEELGAWSDHHIRPGVRWC
jgi:hypothetical protein